MEKVKSACSTVVILLAVFCAKSALGDDVRIYCDLNLKNHYGPFNFYDNSKARNRALELVESAHYSTAMIMLKRGSTTTHISGDLDYTLAVFPNHPGGLDLASRLDKAVRTGARGKWDKLKRSLDCYFMRALTIAPDIGETYYIWGVHYQRNDKFNESLKKYLRAEELGESSAGFYYNLGLLYVDLKDYDKAKGYAEKAYERGYPLEGLRSKLEKAGAW
jgi:tetratricopeptide (TPR) repeat protein